MTTKNTPYGNLFNKKREEVERQLLAELMVKGSAGNTEFDPNLFASTDRKQLAHLIVSLKAEGKPWDLTEVYLKIPEVLKHEYDFILNLSISQLLPAEYYKRELQSLIVQEQIAHAYQTINNPLELAGKIQEIAVSIAGGEKVRSLKEQILELANRLEVASQNPNQLTGITSGLKAIDEITWGFQPGKLVIIAARPSMGKSALSTNMAINAAVAGKSVYIQALEETSVSILNRILSRCTQIPNEQLDRGVIGTHQWSLIQKKLGDINKFKLEIDDASSLNSAQICTRIRQAHLRTPLDIVFIDHLQEVTDGGDSRHLAISQATANFKSLAKSLNIPVILLCQLSRKVEAREDKRPFLSDLKESGDIEQKADVVCFLYRDSYYKHEKPETDLVEFNFAKNRNGRTGSINLFFKAKTMTFTCGSTESTNNVIKSNNFIDKSCSEG